MLNSTEKMRLFCLKFGVSILISSSLTMIRREAVIGDIFSSSYVFAFSKFYKMETSMPYGIELLSKTGSLRKLQNIWLKTS